MRTAAVAFLLSMLFAAVLTPLVRKLAHRYGALDQALTARKIHGRPVPRLGGIAIVIAFFVPLVGLFVLESGVGELFFAEQNLALGIFVGGTLIAGLGVYDDLRGTGAKKKFIVQFLVAGLMYYLGFRVDLISNPFGASIELGWVSLPVTLLWVVGVINAMNLVDGLDGLAGGVALVAVGTVFVVAIHNDQPLLMLSSGALGGAIAGFLLYNFNPASIFMGDSGSMFLGFVLATTAMKTSQKSSTALAAVIPAIILGFPLLDTVLAMARRALRGRPMFHADKEHIHHRLLALGLSHRQAVLVLYGVCLFLSGIAIAITYSGSPAWTMLLLSVVVLAVFVMLRRLGYLRFEVNHYLSDQRRRNRTLRAAVAPMATRLRLASCTEELWDIVRESTLVFEAHCVRLCLPLGTGSDPTAVFSSGFADDRAPSVAMFSARFNLTRTKADDGAIELGWHDGRSSLDRDVEIAIELFCDDVAKTCERIATRTRPGATAFVKVTEIGDGDRLTSVVRPLPDLR